MNNKIFLESSTQPCEYTENEISLLCNDLKKALLHQGFIINGNDKLHLSSHEKNEFKSIQKIAKSRILEQQKHFVLKNIPLVKKYSIKGNEINPNNINLEIIEVKSGSWEEKLFKWWNLTWWNIPYQRPYGRQMRFIIWDSTHNAPFGIISLQSPILRQSVRDKYLSIPNIELDYWVNRSMYAQRIGALPPYNELIGGKLVALALVSNEIKSFYTQKYKDYKTIIKDRRIEPELLFITTTSAFGRSSLYNRLKYNDDLIAKKLGYTEGYGSFQIPDDLYLKLINYLLNIGENAERGYGNGPSRKLKLINLACRKLGLADYSYHGIKREYYSFSLVHNIKQVISRYEQPLWKNYDFYDLFAFWKKRWLIKRAFSNTLWKEFDINLYIHNLFNSSDGEDN